MEECKIPNFLAGDWAWVADVLLRGKAVIVPGLYIYREFEDSTASTIRRMVSALGLPAWHGKAPWLAISASIASYLAKTASGGSELSKLYVYCVVFITAFFRPGNIRLMISEVPCLACAYRFIVTRKDGGRNARHS